MSDYEDFLGDQFDATAYASKIIQGSEFSTSLSILASGIEKLNEELQALVVQQNDELLQQITGIDNLEEILRVTRSGLENLRASVERLHEKVREPFKVIKSKTVQLERLQHASEILRRVIRFLQLSRRLSTQINGAGIDLTKAAQSLNEIDELLEEADLSGIDVIEAEQPKVAKARTFVIQQADETLARALSASNQSEISIGLQVYFNLGQLPQKMKDLLTNMNKLMGVEIRKALDNKTLAQELEESSSKSALGGMRRVGEPSAGMTQAWATALWLRLEKLMDTLFDSCQKIYLLELVLSKKRDPVTHVLFLDEAVKGVEHGIVRSFWAHLSEILEKEFSNATKFSVFLQTTFQSDYPRLLLLFRTFFSRISSLANVQPSDSQSDWTTMKKALGSLETAYLSRSLSKMFDPINASFQGGSKPLSVNAANNILRIFASELELASFDSVLVRSVAKNVAKSLSLLCVSSENLVVTDASAFQMSDFTSLNHSQTVNIEILNSVFFIYDGVWKLLEDKANDVMAVVADSLRTAQKLIGSIVEPLFFGIAESLEVILSKVHQEDYSIAQVAAKAGDTPDMQCSAFLVEFRDKVQLLQGTFISAFRCGSEMKDWISTLASRLMTFFLRNVSIVRPLSESGKLKLAADMAQFEFALAPLFLGTGISAAELGKSYKALRAFRPLIFLETSQVTAAHHRAGLDAIYILHHLFVRASPELQLPHSRAGWSPLQYVQWLDTHSAEEASAFVIRCLDAYASDVQKRGGKQYTPEYPHLRKLVQPDSSSS